MSYNTGRVKFCNSWSGKRLLKTHSITDNGYWMVHGEGDENGCNEPLLGIFKGRLKDVIDYAIVLPRFYRWGNGGDIKPITVTVIDENTVRDRVLNMAKIEQLEKELEQLKKLV